MSKYVGAIDQGTTSSRFMVFDQQGAVVAGPMRTMLFMLTFVAMGAMTDFSKLKGMGKIALLYGLALVVVIAPIAYVVAYLFHRGLMPPLAAP